MFRIFILMVSAGSFLLSAGGINNGQEPKTGKVEKSAPAGGIRQNSRPGPATDRPRLPDEVEEAFADYPKIKNFEKLEKFPGLPEADFRFFQIHYAPPVEGVVIDTDRRRAERLQKISAAVFRLHGIDRQCAVVVLNSRLPTVFTWKLAFVSLTTRDLELLGDEELTALVAHEVGHLYFAAALAQARASGDDRRARLAELKCDLVALETLRRLKIKPEFLPSAIEKLIGARTAMNVKSFDDGSPSLEDRRRLVRLSTEQFERLPVNN